MCITSIRKGKEGGIVQHNEKKKEEVKMAFARIHWYYFNCSWNNSSAIQVVSFLTLASSQAHNMSLIIIPLPTIILTIHTMPTE